MAKNSAGTGTVGYPKAFVTPLTEGPDPSDDMAPLTGNMEFDKGGFSGGPRDPQGLIPLATGNKS